MLWSAGITLSGAAGLAQISALLALVLEQQEQTVFQRLREGYLDGKHKSGKKRRKLEATSCFTPLLRWIVRLWEPGNQQMVLVLDMTTLGERWTILSINAVVRACAIPVVWKVVGGHEKGSWRPHWEGLLFLAHLVAHPVGNRSDMVPWDCFQPLLSLATHLGSLATTKRCRWAG